MEVAFPSGYTFDTDSATELEMTKNVKVNLHFSYREFVGKFFFAFLQKIETKEGETLVVIYFDDIGLETICLELKAYQTHAVANLKPAPVIIYDCYDNCKFNQSFHKTFRLIFFYSKFVVPEAYTILMIAL